MAGPESEHIYGVQLRESANDGSDFSNADTDYRVLFLGEDGSLHVKDAAGSVTDPFSSSGIAASIFDAKGDIIAASAADTAARLAVGTNGYELVAASGETTGLKWQAQPVSAAVTGDGAGNFTSASTTFVDITGASITVTTLARKVKMGFTCLAQASTTGVLRFTFNIDGTDVGGADGLTGANDGSNAIAQPIGLTYMTPSALTAASHTFKARVLINTGTATVQNASADSIWHFWVEECAT